ncbi:zinc ribbon domain-containing protein [Streptomyces populi]
MIAVDPRNTSRTCPACGHTAKENRPAQEEFHCVARGHTAHADTVGAVNVLRAGLVRRDADPGVTRSRRSHPGEESQEGTSMSQGGHRCYVACSARAGVPGPRGS